MHFFFLAKMDIFCRHLTGQLKLNDLFIHFLIFPFLIKLLSSVHQLNFWDLGHSWIKYVFEAKIAFALLDSCINFYSSTNQPIHLLSFLSFLSFPSSLSDQDTCSSDCLNSWTNQSNFRSFLPLLPSFRPWSFFIVVLKPKGIIIDPNIFWKEHIHLILSWDSRSQVIL